MEAVLKATMVATKTVKPASLERVTIETTVQPKAIAHPTDSRLYLKGVLRPVRQAKLGRRASRAARVTVGEKGGGEGRAARPSQRGAVHRISGCPISLATVWARSDYSSSSRPTIRSAR